MSAMRGRSAATGAGPNLEDVGTFHLFVLGVPAVRWVGRGERVAAFRTRKELALLVYLALTHAPQSREQLAALLWPDHDPAAARSLLRTTLSRLRQHLAEAAGTTAEAITLLRTEQDNLGREVISIDRDRTPSLRVDVELLEAAVSHPAGRTGGTGQAPTTGDHEALLWAAVEAYRGPFLEGVQFDDAPEFDEWVGGQRAHWESQVQLLLARLAELQLERRAFTDALTTGQRWLGLNPLSEAAYRALMRALAATGDRAGALTLYEQCRAVLQAQLHLSPSPETVALAERLRRLPASSSPSSAMSHSSPAGRSAGKPSTAPAARAEPTQYELELPFVGREREFAAMVSAYRVAQAGEVQVVVLEGEAGIGKTRLAEEFLAWATLEGADVLRGQGRGYAAGAAGATLPYQPLVDALRPRLERENAPEDLLEDVWLAELARLFPELRERYPDLPPPSAQAGVEAAGQARLFEALLHLILALAESARPGALVSFYDDLQWSDLATRDVLLYLLKRSHEATSTRLIVLGVRREALLGDSALADWLGMVSRQVPTSHLVLEPLDQSETKQALDAVLTHPSGTDGPGGDLDLTPGHQLGSWLYAQTEGQPFYLVETLRALVDRGILVPEVPVPHVSSRRGADYSPQSLQSRRLTVAAGVDRLPRLLAGSVRDLIKSRLAGLSPPATEMLAAAAVLGPEATFERMALVAALDESGGLTSLDELLQRRLLVEEGSGGAASPRVGAGESGVGSARVEAARFRFAQNLVREVVYTEAGDTRRRILHRRALTILEREGVSPAKQAHHALALGLTEQALRSSVEAGEAALAVFAEGDAQAHYAAAQRLLTGPVDQVAETEPAAAPPKWHDWGEAPDVPRLYGRSEEMATLLSWVRGQGCRVIELLGVGGIGKTSLAARLSKELAPEFPVVYWRSLRNAPPPEEWLAGAIAAVSMGQAVVPEGFDARLRLLLGLLRVQRSLLVIDNLETVLEPGAVELDYRPGYESYGAILKQLAESVHQGCLLLTSREQPLPAGDGDAAVRAIRLEGLGIDEAQALLGHRSLLGDDAAWEALVEGYGGNALALQIVGETISVVFDGEIDAFLGQAAPAVGGIRQLLDEQLARLSRVERAVLNWLAIEREPVRFATLAGDMGAEATRGELVEAVQALGRRSLLERRARAEPTGTNRAGVGERGVGGFTLQPVVLEYVSERLVASLATEIEAGHTGDTGDTGDTWLLSRYPIVLATAKDYVRQSQERLIGRPVLDRLRTTYRGQSAVAERLRSTLTVMAALADEEQGYGPANLVALLRLLRGDLRGLDLSRLVLRNAYLQGVDMQDASLAGAIIKDSVFTNAFDMIASVDISRNGQYWAAASGHGEVYVWQADGQSLHRVWRDPIVRVWRLALSPDGSVVAGGTSEGEIKLWDVASGVLLWSAGRHTSAVRDVVFSPDGTAIASRGADATVRVWDRYSGAQRQDLSHPVIVTTIAWSPDGKLLASADIEGTIRLWQVSPENAFADSTGSGQAQGASLEQWSCVQTYQDDGRQRIDGLAFSPDSGTLASTNFDGTVRLWDLVEARLQQTLAEGDQGGGSLAWSPDGRTLAGVRRDHTVWLWNWENWDPEQGGHITYRTALRGHTQNVGGVAFTPDSQSLLSGSLDGSLRVWDVATGQCTRTVEGYAASLGAVDWSPDATRLVTSGRERQVSVYDASGKAAPHVLYESNDILVDVVWSPDGRIIAGAEHENSIRLWDAVSGEMHLVLRHPDDPLNRFYSLAWSPDGKWLAAGTLRYGVLVWDVAASLVAQPGLRWHWPKPPNPIRAPNRMEWSPDAAYLATGVDEGTVYVWDAASGGLLHRLEGHQGRVTCVTWSLDAHRLASAGTGSESGELFVWDMQKNSELVCTINTNPDSHIMVCWGSLEGAKSTGREEVLISGGSDGALRWWNLDTGECEKVRMSHVGKIAFFKRSPDGTRLASCGDDGAIMIWDLQTGEHLQTLRRDRPYERLDITGIKGLTEAQKATLRALGAVESGSD